MTFGDLCERIDEISEQQTARPGFLRALKDELAKLATVSLTPEQEKNKPAVEDKPDAVLLSAVVLSEGGDLLASFITVTEQNDVNARSCIKFDKLVGPAVAVSCFLSDYSSAAQLIINAKAGNLCFNDCYLISTEGAVTTEGMTIVQNVTLYSASSLSAADTNGRHKKKD